MAKAAAPMKPRSGSVVEVTFWRGEIRMTSSVSTSISTVAEGVTVKPGMSPPLLVNAAWGEPSVSPSHTATWMS